MSRFIASAISLGVIAVSTTLAQSEPSSSRPLPFDAVVNMQSFVRPTVPGVALSPNGRYLAYAVRDEFPSSVSAPPTAGRTKTGMPARYDGAVLYVTDLQQNTTAAVTVRGHSAYSPVWSPDSRKLAFYYDASGTATVWTWEPVTRALSEVAKVAAHPHDTFSLFWTPDSQAILARLAVQEQRGTPTEMPRHPSRSARDAQTTVKVYEFDPRVTAVDPGFTPDEGSKRILRADLGLLSVDTGRVRTIARNISSRCFWLSPDGQSVAFTSPLGYQGNDIYRYMWDLVVVDVRSGTTRVVANRIRLTALGANVSWSPDSRSLAYVQSEVSHRAADQAADGQFYTVPADGSSPPRRGTDSPHPHLGHSFRAPVWSADGTRLYGANGTGLWEVDIVARTARPVGRLDGKAVLHILTSSGGSKAWPSGPDNLLTVVTRDDVTKNEGFHVISSRDGAVRRAWEAPVHIAPRNILDCDATYEPRVVACIAESFQASPHVLVSTDDLRELRQVTKINSGLDGHRMGETQLLEWLDPDGYPVQGALLLPPDYRPGVRLPLLVAAYPRKRFSDEIHHFGDRPITLMQLFTTRGYAVLCPDMPLRERGLMRDAAAAVLPGINAAIEKGIADPERIGVLGESFGGYSVMALITQSTRFKAAVAMSGFANLVGAYGSLRGETAHFAVGLLESQEFVGGSPWEVRERYIENSPVFYLDRVATPLMLLHGTADTSASPRLADEIFVGLRRLRKHVVYAQYEDEGHYLQLRANRLDAIQRIVAWFDRHLKAASPANPVTSASR